MGTLTRVPVLRWLAPVLAAVLLVGGGWAATHLTATAQPGLRPQTPAQLLVDVQQARLAGLSGTVQQRADLGLPALPGGSGSSDLSSLVSGDHTLKVWYSAPGKARLALLGEYGESDVVRNGRDLWVWSSHDRTVTHRRLDRPSTTHPGHDRKRWQAPNGLPATPQQAARALLRAVGPTTRVTSTANTTVAGRSAYELVLVPRTPGSLVGEVRIAIDGATHVPLRVQVFPRGATQPAFETGFTSVDFSRPDPSVFAFTPPQGAKVVQPQGSPGQLLPGWPGPGSPDREGRKHDGGPGHGAGPAPTVVGHGWATVLVGRLPAAASAGVGLPDQLSRVVRSLPKVSGDWGSGRLLRGKLFSVVLTDDGRVAAGAVTPQRLYHALNRS